MSTADKINDLIFRSEKLPKITHSRRYLDWIKDAVELLDTMKREHEGLRASLRNATVTVECLQAANSNLEQERALLRGRIKLMNERMGEAIEDLGQWCSLARETIQYPERRESLVPHVEGIDATTAVMKRVVEAMLSEIELVDFGVYRRLPDGRMERL
ncbi:MAG TPA: hypothetical protein VM223_25750 [Planctomycetota bacterium]|nr:hypothetical protein [Planctomycetota bacterium]